MELEVIVLVKEACNYCEESQKNRFLALTTFGSILTVGVVYVVVQRLS